MQIGILILLAVACAVIALPFVGLLLWSMILAVMLHPLHLWLQKRLGNKWSATLIGVVGITLILAPTVVVVTSLASSLSSFVGAVQNDTLVVPPPPPRLASIPVVGAKLTEAWAATAANAPAALAKYGPMIKAPASSMASAVGKLAAAELLFILSFGIAAVFIAYAKSSTDYARRLLSVLTGSATRGAHLVVLMASTVRGVAVGIVGVAAIQTLLLGAGFFLIGLPAAGLFTVVILLLGIVQIPATIITLPLIIYVFATEPTTPAIIFGIWTLVMGLSDNALKPLMLGRGLEVPMPVILIGVIGGMIANGLLGLFVGPVILAIGYVLFSEWLRDQPVNDHQAAVASS
jgi:predicted PurR-regulated permease PerM